MASKERMKFILLIVLISNGKTSIQQTYFYSKEQCQMAAKAVIGTEDVIVKSKTCINF